MRLDGVEASGDEVGGAASEVDVGGLLRRVVGKLLCADWLELVPSSCSGCLQLYITAT